MDPEKAMGKQIDCHGFAHPHCYRLHRDARQIFSTAAIVPVGANAARGVAPFKAQN